MYICSCSDNSQLTEGVYVQSFVKKKDQFEATVRLKPWKLNPEMKQQSFMRFRV